MIKNALRITIAFALLFLSNNLTSNQAVAIDGGGPTPICPSTGCVPPAFPVN